MLTPEEQSIISKYLANFIPLHPNPKIYTPAIHYWLDHISHYLPLESTTLDVKPIKNLLTLWYNPAKLLGIPLNSRDPRQLVQHISQHIKNYLKSRLNDIWMQCPQDHYLQALIAQMRDNTVAAGSHYQELFQQQLTGSNITTHYLNYARFLMKNSRIDEAEVFLNCASELGCEIASFYYAGLYKIKLKNNPQQASSLIPKIIESYEKGVKSGDPETMHQYALFLKDNPTLPQSNPTVVANYYKQAADKGHPYAQFNYAELSTSMLQQLPPEKYKEGLHYYSLAAEQGWSLAEESLAMILIMYNSSSTANVAKGLKMLQTMADDYGSARSLHLYAHLLQSNDVGIGKDIGRAVEYYRKASDLGHPDATYQYIKYLEQGWFGKTEFTKPQPELARKLLKSNCLDNYQPALNRRLAHQIADAIQLNDKLLKSNLVDNYMPVLHPKLAEKVPAAIELRNAKLRQQFDLILAGVKYLNTQHQYSYQQLLNELNTETRREKLLECFRNIKDFPDLKKKLDQQKYNVVKGSVITAPYSKVKVIDPVIPVMVKETFRVSDHRNTYFTNKLKRKAPEPELQPEPPTTTTSSQNTTNVSSRSSSSIAG